MTWIAVGILEKTSEVCYTYYTINIVQVVARRCFHAIYRSYFSIFVYKATSLSLGVSQPAWLPALRIFEKWKMVMIQHLKTDDLHIKWRTLVDTYAISNIPLIYSKQSLVAMYSNIPCVYSVYTNIHISIIVLIDE